MNTLNRFFIFILLLALLYALWRYQQYILGSDDDVVDDSVPKLTYKKQKSRSKRSRSGKSVVDDESLDNITIDNVSQFSLGSMEDVRTNQQSFMDSMDSGDNLSFLDDNQSRESRESFFFEEAQ